MHKNMWKNEKFCEKSTGEGKCKNTMMNIQVLKFEGLFLVQLPLRSDTLQWIFRREGPDIYILVIHILV